MPTTPGVKTPSADMIQKISFFSFSDEDALSHLRFTAAMETLGIQIIKGVENGQVVPVRALEGDLVVLQRDFPRDYKAYQEVRALSKENDIKIVMDLDDLIFELPESHPDRQSKLYTEALLPMLLALAKADLVTVSSQKLKEFIEPINPNVNIIKNYFDDSIWRLRKPVVKRSTDQPLTIAYMGSESHRSDIDLILPALLDVAKRYSGKIKFHFWGLEPPSELSHSSPTEWTPVRSHKYKDFAADFQQLDADIFIAPLLDDLFNQCKSIIKFLEYGALGIPGVYSASDPYSQIVKDNLNGLLAGSLSEWAQSLSQLIEDEQLRFRLANEAQDTIRRDWLLSDHADEWLKPYLDLLKPRKRKSASAIAIKAIEPIAEQLTELYNQRKSNQQNLEVQLDELQANNTQLRVEKEQLKNEIDQKAHLLQDVSAKLIERDDSIREMEFHANELENQVHSMSESLEQRELTIQGMEFHANELENQVHSMSESLEQKELAIQDLTALSVLDKQNISQLSEMAGKSEQKVQELSDCLTQKMDQADDLQNKNLELRHSIGNLSESLAFTQKELSDIKSTRLWRIRLFYVKVRSYISMPNSSDSKWQRFIKSFLWPIRILTTHQKHQKEKKLILNSGLFIKNWYESHNPDVAAEKSDPLSHYLYFGGFEGRDPGPDFSSAGYLNAYGDVRTAHVNPLIHYLKHGITEGRSPTGYRKQEAQPQTSSQYPAVINTFEQIEKNDMYYRTYQNLLEVAGKDQSNDYVKIANNPPLNYEEEVKTIAFYLPQFHPISENDLWWGKGFTEWTNVTKAVPQFEGHDQPHLPGELGFYDLRLYEVQQRQIELAKNYGIYGFCFHYYWFNGKRLLERPLNQFLEHPENKFPFCICWANENWTRRWDGYENDVLIAQEHSLENDKRFITDLEPLLRDERYIRIKGRPLIIIYRPGLIKKPLRTAEYWREFCVSKNLGDPLIVGAQTFGFEDPSSIGFDAAVEFPPHNILYTDIKHEIKLLNENYAGSIYDYREMVEKNVVPPTDKKYRVFRTVIPNWDNEARKPGRGFSFINSTPAQYRQWLDQVSHAEKASHPLGERLIFINAWNEWGESAYLEPDRKYGYAYLQATYDAIENASSKKFLLNSGNFNLNPKKSNETAVVMHVYYTELFVELAKYLKNIPGGFDLYVSLPEDKKDFSKTIFEHYPNAQIFLTQNKGRDIAPFIEIFRMISHCGYAALLKLHTKKSTHRQDGSAWRDDILSKLLGSKVAVCAVREEFDSTQGAGLIGPQGHILDHRIYWGFNKEKTLNLAKDAGIYFNGDPQFSFIAGSMFWAKPEALTYLNTIPINASDFEPEPTPPDGALAHAVERFIGLAAKAKGYSIKEIDEKGTISDPKEGNLYAFAVPFPQ